MRTLTGSSLFTVQPAIPQKTIETNEKKTLRQNQCWVWAISGLQHWLGEGGVDLKRVWIIGETNFSDGLNIFCERLWDLSWITAEPQDPHCSHSSTWDFSWITAEPTLGPFMDNSRTETYRVTIRCEFKKHIRPFTFHLFHCLFQGIFFTGTCTDFRHSRKRRKILKIVS